MAKILKDVPEIEGATIQCDCGGIIWIMLSNPIECPGCGKRYKLKTILEELTEV